MRAFLVATALLVAAGCGGTESSEKAARTIAFAGGKCCGFPEEVPLDIWVMDADGGDRVRLTRDATSEVDPSWSPDGTKIVSNLAEDLSVIDIATGEETEFEGWISSSWQRIAAGEAPAPVPEPGLP